MMTFTRTTTTKQIYKFLLVLTITASTFQHDQTPDLRHRFHHQHARHDWPLREMPGEKVVVDGDVLDADGVRALLDFQDSVD